MRVYEDYYFIQGPDRPYMIYIDDRSAARRITTTEQHAFSDRTTAGPRIDPAGIISVCDGSEPMERQQLIALFFAFLMMSSMVAWGISLL